MSRPIRRVADLFGFDVYQGGATALEALRRTIGDDAFFELLQQWVQRNDGRRARPQDFIALAEEIAGTDLTEFFDEWMFAERQPTSLPPATSRRRAARYRRPDRRRAS